MENQNHTKLDNTYSLIDVLSVYFKYKNRILLLTVVACIIYIIIYFFVLDKIYFSNASVKSSTKSSGLLGALESGIPDIGGLDDIGIGNSKSAKELAAYEEILYSRRCLEGLINKFGLKEELQYDYMEDVIKHVKENMLEVKQEKLSGIMYIGVYYKDPLIAQQMVGFLIDELNKINIEMNVLNAKNNREFIEKRYFQARTDLAGTEDTLKAFQKIYGIAPDLQIKASVQSLYAIEAELKSEEVKLDVIKNILSADQPEVKLQESKVNALKNKISEIQFSTDNNDLLKLGNSPDIGLSYLRLQREVEIQGKIVTFLLPIYEQSKIEEKRETPSILLLDKPYLAEKKSKPKRFTMVVVLTFITFFVLLITFIIYSRIKLFISLPQFQALKSRNK